MPKPTPTPIDDLLPIKAVDYEVLLALHDEELHGYGVAKSIEARTEGRLRLEPANLYRRIARLVESGLVEAAARRRSASATDERRRYFRITALGLEVLKAETLRMRDQVEAAAARSIVPRARRSR